MGRKRDWFMKSEPQVYSIDDLERDGVTCWEGVRNYQARNNMMAVKKGDEILFCHSNAKPPGVVGVARVVREAYPDRHAFEKGHKYFDAKADPELADMELVRFGRLSAPSVKKAEFDRTRKLGGLD